MEKRQGEVKERRIVFMGIEGRYGVLRFGYCPGGMGVWICGKGKREKGTKGVFGTTVLDEHCKHYL